MPRRLIQAPKHDRKNALWVALWWIETFTVHGPGDVVGEPTVFVDEYAGFVVDCYALDADGRRLYDSAFFSRPKGCDKSGLAAKLALLEGLGPCRFAGYATGGETYEFLGQVYTYKPGEPMGRAVTTPYVRVMATEEGQTGNVYDTIYYNLTDDNAPLSALRAYGLDPGLTRIILPYGGEITPSTSGAASKDGGKETFVVFDESHLYNTPQLVQMHATVSRNLVKRRKMSEGWYIETTTMFAPDGKSVAEKTFDLANQIFEGKVKRPRAMFDHRWGDVPNLADEEDLRRGLREAYGDALQWVDLNGLVDSVFDPRQTETASRRYFLNVIVASENAWITPDEYKRVSTHTPKLEKGDVITLGFDGSKNDDATALVACRVSDRALFLIAIDELPDGPEADGWTVNREKFDKAVSDAFRDYEVVGFFADPPHWQDYVDAWNREYGDQLTVNASAKHAIEWWTNRDTAMILALERLHDAITEQSMSFEDPETPLGAILRRHVQNARNWPRRGGFVIGKDRRGSAKKIDAAMAAVLAFEAAAEFVNAPKPKKKNNFVPIRVR
jgi:hypothetical protein